MHATVRVYQGASELAAELVRNQESVKSLIEGVPGFRAYYLVDTGDGAVSFTVCDDEAGTAASNAAAAGWIRENLPNLSIAPPAISAGEVVISGTA